MPAMWLRLIVLVVLMAAGTRSAFALDVTEVEWGFDGKLVPMTFNPITVNVINDGRETFEGSVVLRMGDVSLGGELPIVESGLYLTPGEDRRVRFYPFISELPSSASLEWGQGQRVSIMNDMQAVRYGRPAVVQIINSSFSRVVQAKIPTFDEEIFPSSVTGLGGLKVVVLDHVPRWDAPRFQALRDWVEAGGTLHLFQGDTGEFPTFQAPLEVFNEPSDKIDVGSGRVYRHAARMSAIDEAFARTELGYENQQDPNEPNRRDYNYDYQWSLTSNLPPMLRSLTRPHHNWALIYLLSFAYLAVVFPGCWLLGRRRADFRITYPILIGAVVLFSLAFKTVGQRGYGEETAWNAVGIARPLGGGRWLTENWSNAFVTSGGEYTYKHAADGVLYSTGNTNDARGGRIENQPNGSFTADIPPFSSLTMLNAGVVTGPDWKVKLASVDRSGDPPQFKFTTEGQLPGGAMRAIYKSSVYSIGGGGGTWSTSNASPLNQHLQVQRYGYGMYYDTPSGQNVYDDAEVPMIARSLGVRNDQQRAEASLPADRVRFMIWGEAAPEFLNVTGGPTKRQGRMLYVFELPIPEGT